MSEVWLADDRQSGSPVALKILAAQLAGNNSYRGMLHKEWQLGLRLMHANIVRVFEYCDDPQRPFYSLQYLDGPDISISSQCELADVLRPIGLICDALRYAHGKEIVHRDIKAGNILLDSKGVPYLIDFGVAATGLQDGVASGGSVIAASPQQLHGETPAPSDDIFALGGLIFELITGSCPYGSNPMAEDIVGKTVPALSDVVSGNFPAGLQELLNEMLNKSAAMRPDAESIGQRLAAMGFPAGVVPRRLLPLVANTGTDIEVESVEVTQPFRSVDSSAAATTLATTRSGISPKTTFIALAVMALLLIAVIFVLPNTVSTDVPQAEAGTKNQQVTEPRELPGAGDAEGFNENVQDGARDKHGKRLADEVLGELLSKLERLKKRAVDRWAGQTFRDAENQYAAGDKAYLAGNYSEAATYYQQTIDLLDPLLTQVDSVFDDTLERARDAFETGQSADALRLYELAAAITPGDVMAAEGLERARNLDAVMALTRQGLEYERDQDLQAARLAIEKALALDPLWQLAIDANARINESIEDWSFNERMSEGFNALADGHFASARAAFKVAQEIKPGSTEPRDGLLQVDQSVRLARIANLSAEADGLVANERWEEAVLVYKSILEIDSSLDFATTGLAAANDRVKMHNTLGGYIADPDGLSDPATLQRATMLLLQIARMREVGPRLENQKTELSRLLKRATTELTVQLLSDNATEVAVYKVGKLGSFETRELSLRPGTYVAVGSRPGYRDVRLEFRVAPEVDLQPIVIRCEEQI